MSDAALASMFTVVYPFSLQRSHSAMHLNDGRERTVPIGHSQPALHQLPVGRGKAHRAPGMARRHLTRGQDGARAGPCRTAERDHLAGVGGIRPFREDLIRQPLLTTGFPRRYTF
jgi:hypothetical protein